MSSQQRAEAAFTASQIVEEMFSLGKLEGKSEENSIDTYLHLVDRLVGTTFHSLSHKQDPFSSKIRQLLASCIICLPYDVTRQILAKYFTNEK